MEHGASRQKQQSLGVNFVLKMMGFVLNTMDFVLKMMDFVLKLMEFVFKTGLPDAGHPGYPQGQRSALL